jgi:hypothetical protein
LPHIEKAFEKYVNDDKVAFVLVSIDDDPERLAQYVAERKFKMTVARMSFDDAEKLMGVKNTPTGFYVDRTGVVRYETEGADTHGDAADRVTWYIEELKGSK